MNEKLTQYLNGVFAPYEGVKSAAELKADLHTDLQERFRELKAQGHDDDTALQLTIDSIGDIEQTVQEVAQLSRTLERQVHINFSASNLPQSDLAGVTVHKGKFDASVLRGSDFSGSDLTGSTFNSSDVREANFDRANLTDCTLATSDLAGATFRQAIVVRTHFNMSELKGATFSGVKFVDVKFSMLELNHTVFEDCSFHGVDFKYCDLHGLRLDGQTFVGVKFDNASLEDTSFQGATLKQVSFLAAQTWLSWSKKYYRALKTIHFDGARMDKLTYAALKGLGVDLSGVTLI